MFRLKTNSKLFQGHRLVYLVNKPHFLVECMGSQKLASPTGEALTADGKKLWHTLGFLLWQRNLTKLEEANQWQQEEEQQQLTETAANETAVEVAKRG